MRKRVIQGGIAGVLVLLVSACGGVQYAPIEVKDNSATILSAKANWQPWKQQAGSSDISVEQGFELQHVRASGEETQTLSAGETIAVGGGTITGPEEISHRVDLYYTHLAYSGTGRLSKTTPLDLDVFMGIGRVDFRLRSSGSVSGSELRTSLTDYGLSMGLGLRWWFVAKSAVEGRLILFTQNPFSYLGGSFGNGDQTDLWEAELVWVFAPVKNVAIRAGYAMLDCTPEKTGESSLEAKMRGPFLGLGVLF